MSEHDGLSVVGEWVREPNDDGTRFGTWYYVLGGRRWELERRTGQHDDFGWYLTGPDGSPFVEYVARQLGPAKRWAEDVAHEVPGAREALTGADWDGLYVHRS